MEDCTEDDGGLDRPRPPLEKLVFPIPRRERIFGGRNGIAVTDAAMAVVNDHFTSAGAAGDVLCPTLRIALRWPGSAIACRTLLAYSPAILALHNMSTIPAHIKLPFFRPA